MPQIHCFPDDQIVDISEKETILHAVLYAGISHAHVCGGEARCSTCRVIVTEGVENCSPRTSLEQNLAKKLGLPNNIRLACQTKLSGDISMRRLVLDGADIEIISDQLKIGSIGEEKFLAIMFTDIRGFTRFSEEMLAYDVIYILNRYFQSMGQVIQKYNGVINNYMGDGLMALFGIDHPDTASECAVSAAVEMLESLQELNSHLQSLYKQPLRIGIGIHYGWAVLGEVGASKNKRVTVIGDTVNLASRIESANKELGTSILISQDVYNQIKDNVEINAAHEVSIPGKSGKYQLYEVSDMRVRIQPIITKPTQQNLSSLLLILGSFLNLASLKELAIKIFERIRKILKR